jgi:hypothetical protein
MILTTAISKEQMPIAAVKIIDQIIEMAKVIETEHVEGSPRPRA